MLKRIKEGTTNCAVLRKFRSLAYEGKSTIQRDFVRSYREAPITRSKLFKETLY